LFRRNRAAGPDTLRRCGFDLCRDPPEHPVWWPIANFAKAQSTAPHVTHCANATNRPPYSRDRDSGLFPSVVVILLLTWLISASAPGLAARGAPATAVHSPGDAPYRRTAMSTAGIADTPVAVTDTLIGRRWVLIGSALLIGTLIATVTSCFMRPLQRPAHQTVATIGCNLELCPTCRVTHSICSARRPMR